MTSTTQALPLGNGISSQICTLITQYLQNQDNWIPQIVGSEVLPYKKQDLTIAQFPNITCTKSRNLKRSLGGFEAGEINIELRPPLNFVRDDLQQYMEQFVGLLELINLRGSLTNYCKQGMFGLWWVGKKFAPNFKDLYTHKTEPVVNIACDYKVSLQAYRYGLEANGFSLFSPDQVVYNLAQDLTINNALIGDTDDDELCAKSNNHIPDCTGNSTE